MIWLRAVVSVLDDLPRQVRLEAEQLRWRDAHRRRVTAELAAATWVCRHGDAWRTADGRLLRAIGTLILPLPVWDAEDFHGYSADPSVESLPDRINRRLVAMREEPDR